MESNNLLIINYLLLDKGSWDFRYINIYGKAVDKIHIRQGYL